MPGRSAGVARQRALFAARRALLAASIPDWFLLQVKHRGAILFAACPSLLTRSHPRRVRAFSRRRMEDELAELCNLLDDPPIQCGYCKMPVLDIPHSLCMACGKVVLPRELRDDTIHSEVDYTGQDTDRDSNHDDPEFVVDLKKPPTIVRKVNTVSPIKKPVPIKCRSPVGLPRLSGSRTQLLTLEMHEKFEILKGGNRRRSGLNALIPSWDLDTTCPSPTHRHC